MKKYAKVIIRSPTQSIIDITLRNPYLNKPDFDIAIRQYKRYIQALEYIGIDIVKLEEIESSPYAFSTSDQVIIVPNQCAIITNMIDKKRKTEILDIKNEINKNFSSEQIYQIKIGDVRGSDVVVIGNTFFVGKSIYTNNKGIKELSSIASKLGKQVVTIELFDYPNLMSCISYLENNLLLVSSKISDKKQFQGFKRVVVPEEEEYALGSVWINGVVITPINCPRTTRRLRSLGYRVIELNFSEFNKIDISPCMMSIRI